MEISSNVSTKRRDYTRKTRHGPPPPRRMLKTTNKDPHHINLNTAPVPASSATQTNMRRLFLDAQDLPAAFIHLIHPEPRRIRNRFQEDAGTGGEGLYIIPHVILEDIIPEDHSYIFIVCEIFCQGEGMGDSAGFVLNLVGEAGSKICT